MSKYEPVEIRASKGPTYQFSGKEAGFVTTQNRAGTKDRWTEITVYETSSGKMVIETAGCSARDGDHDLIDVAVIDADGRRCMPDLDPRTLAALDFMGWSAPARELAKQMGWSIIARID